MSDRGGDGWTGHIGAVSVTCSVIIKTLFLVDALSTGPVERLLELSDARLDAERVTAMPGIIVPATAEANRCADKVVGSNGPAASM